MLVGRLGIVLVAYAGVVADGEGTHVRGRAASRAGRRASIARRRARLGAGERRERRRRAGRRARQRIVVIGARLRPARPGGVCQRDDQTPSCGDRRRDRLRRSPRPRHGEGATSTAWYCAGPLPLGLRAERARVAIANVSAKTVRGELLVATETGVARAVHVTVAAHESVSFVLPSPGHSAFGAATVLLDAAGVGVQELVTGPTGTDASPCVSHATAVQYLSGGATKDGAALDLAIFDPGATPSVANVSFATPGGRVTPPAYQQMPIEAGQTLVLDVGRYLPVQPLIATTVTAGGGRVVVGAIATAVVAKTTFPALVSATAVPETTWYFAAEPVGRASARPAGIMSSLNPRRQHGAGFAELRPEPSPGAGDAGSTASLPPAAVSPGSRRTRRTNRSEPARAGPRSAPRSRSSCPRESRASARRARTSPTASRRCRRD